MKINKAIGQNNVCKKLFALLGIIVTIAHLTYYIYAQYDALYFFLGFGMLWLVFVAPMKYLF